MAEQRIVDTTVDVGFHRWRRLRRKDLVKGRLVVTDQGQARMLRISCDSGPSIEVDQSAIVAITNVASGLKIVVDILYLTFDDARGHEVCLRGPRRQIKEICAALGEPL